MSMRTKEKDLIAPEQYEMKEKPSHIFSMNRRRFFEVLGSGVAVTFTISNSLGNAIVGVAPEDQVAAWIHVGENGMVTVYTGKVEVGQNIRTSLAQIVAEELHVPMEKIEMVMGDTSLTPYDRGTFGSLSTPVMGPKLRKAAASAREILLDMAAASMKSDRKKLLLENGVIKDTTTGKSVKIGQVAKGQKLLKPVNDNVSVTPVNEWKVAGTSVKKVKGESFLTGKHKYVSDMKLPDMLYGKILRAPAYGAKLKSVDISAAEKMPGVTVVHDGDFVGVAARDVKTASNAIGAINAEWTFSPQPSRTEIFDYIKSKAETGKDEDTAGDAATTFSKAPVKVEGSFKIDYIAHAPLEPRAGLAQWTNNKLTVWTGTQRPFAVQEDLAEAFGIPKENIRVIQPDTGSGYGGKHTGEAGIEAARLAQASRKPVKIVWTREEEFTWAYFRPAGVIDVKAGATTDGILTSWEFHNYNSGGAAIETSYHVENRKIQFHPMESPLRQGSYRALASTANVYARECIMNDLATEIKMDPLQFRLKNLREERMKGVLEAAATKFGWSRGASTASRGIGIACGTAKGGFVATCAEIEIDSSENILKVLRVVTAFDCGAVINPGHLESQIQGAVIQGLGGALFERVDFKDGKILNPSFSEYRVPRFSDTPQMEVVMVNRKDLPSAGAGEAPIVGIAPAIRNAVVNAVGKKIYTLPIGEVG
jgi:nicotinate dehydrogenase subunit B